MGARVKHDRDEERAKKRDRLERRREIAYAAGVDLRTFDRWMKDPRTVMLRTRQALARAARKLGADLPKANDKGTAAQARQ